MVKQAHTTAPRHKRHQGAVAKDLTRGVMIFIER